MGKIQLFIVLAVLIGMINAIPIHVGNHNLEGERVRDEAPHKEIPKQAVHQPPVKSTIECSICEIVILRAQAFFDSSMTEQQFIQDLETECQYFGSYNQSCDALVELYGPYIYEMVSNKSNPNVVCHDIGICSNNTVPHVFGGDTHKHEDLDKLKEVQQRHQDIQKHHHNTERKHHHDVNNEQVAKVGEGKYPSPYKRFN